jgi:hypothetical protein
MLDCHLEEDDPIPQFRECDYCKELYCIDDGYISLKSLDAAYCSGLCAESYDEEMLIYTITRGN